MSNTVKAGKLAVKLIITIELLKIELNKKKYPLQVYFIELCSFDFY